MRRVKQGVAEWYRLQLREKIWKGLIEHSADGWNIGTVPYGYAAEKVTHPSPIKAAYGLTKTRLVIDPVRGPVVVQVFTWRTLHKLAMPTISARLNADPAAYPSPDGTGWTQSTMTGILRNPKYTGYMVFGRKRTVNGKKRPVPPADWLWSPQPSHPALIERATWDTAQQVPGQRGNTRDTEMPTTQPGRRYPLRARLRCNACQRRMHGITKRNRQGRPYSYYVCSHDHTNPRLAAQYPDHPRVTVREETISQAVATFIAERLLGPDRAAMLAAALPADAAEQTARHAETAGHLRKQLARIDTAERALITELETAADPADPAAQAYRARIRARYAELYDERTRTETALDAAETANHPGRGPHAPRRAAPGRGHRQRRAGPDQGSHLRRVRHPRPLPPRPAPGHHLGHHHPGHPRHHRRPDHRPPHQQRHPARHPARPRHQHQRSVTVDTTP